MVHLIWKRRRPRLDELQHFKGVCYDVYLEFSISGNVNHNLFNQSIKQYQLHQFNFNDYEQPEIKVNNTANVLLNDETQYVADEYLNENDKPDLPSEQLNHILKLSYGLDSFTEEINLFINHQKSTSVYFDSLINIVGYGRIVNIFKILLQTGDIKLHSLYEYRIVEMAFYYGLHKHIINITNYDDCSNCNYDCKLHLRYFFLCEDCLTVNKHNKKYDKSLTLEEKVCTNFTWFGKQGKILANEFNTLLMNKIIIDDKAIIKTSNLDYYSILHNLFSAKQKQKLVEEDKILKAMIKKQTDERSFSGFMYNDDILDRKEKLLKFNKKQEVFHVPTTFSSFSPTKTLTDQDDSLSVTDSEYIATLKSPVFTNDNNKSVSFEAGDICPDCSSVFEQQFGSIKCKCRSISTSFSVKKFSFLNSD